MSRRLIVGIALATLLAGVVAGVVVVWRIDWASVAAARLTSRMGRTVTIGRLEWSLGRSVHVELADLVVANLPDGTAPAMATVARVSAEVGLGSILSGPLLVQRAEVSGLHVLLERTPSGPNWRTGSGEAADPTGRTGFPSLRDVQVRDSELVVITRRGHRLVTRFDTVAIGSAADDQGVELHWDGAYQGNPIRLTGALQPETVLRQAGVPYGTVLHVVSGDTALEFDGTMTNPLHVDGAAGRLQLDAPSMETVMKLLGSASRLEAALHLDGTLERQDDVWRLHDAQGSLLGGEVLRGGIELTEGLPDRVVLDLVFGDLDLNSVLGEGPPGRRSADMGLSVDAAPDPVVSGTATAKRVEYGSLVASDVSVRAAQEAGRVVVAALSLTLSGAPITASGRIEAAEAGGRVAAEVTVSGVDVQVLRRALGFGPVPVTGRLEGRLTVEGTARTLNLAAEGARVSAIVAMRGGTIAREVVEMASTDVRALFRTAKGASAVTCLLAGLDLRGGVGVVAPLRVRAADGVIAGSARLDLKRRTVDLVIGSESRSTGLFALDIPVRVAGPFASPSVSPAQWTAQGRAQLAAADSLQQLPPALREAARRYPCPR